MHFEYFIPDQQQITRSSWNMHHHNFLVERPQTVLWAHAMSVVVSHVVALERSLVGASLLAAFQVVSPWPFLTSLAAKSNLLARHVTFFRKKFLSVRKQWCVHKEKCIYSYPCENNPLSYSSFSETTASFSMPFFVRRFTFSRNCSGLTIRLCTRTIPLWNTFGNIGGPNQNPLIKLRTNCFIQGDLTIFSGPTSSK